MPTFIISILIVLVSIFSSFTANNASAASSCKLDENTLHFFALNNILYYCPSATSNNCSSNLAVGEQITALNIHGETIEELIWTGLTSFMDDSHAAAAMGNIQSESLLSPAMHEQSLKNKLQPGFDLTTIYDNDGKKISYGIGLIQWSGGRRANFYNYMMENAPDLTKTYIDDYETYSDSYAMNGAYFLDKAGYEVTASLVALEINYLKIELESYSQYNAFLTETGSPEDLADVFTQKIEGIPPKDVRRANARQFYDTYHGKNISSQSYNPSTNTCVGGNPAEASGDSAIVSKNTGNTTPGTGEFSGYSIVNTKISPQEYSSKAQRSGFYQSAHDSWGSSCLSVAHTMVRDMLTSSNYYKGTSFAGLSRDTITSNEKGEILAKIYEEITAGRPVVLKVRNGAAPLDTRHFVVIIGIRTDAINTGVVSDTDLLYLDPWNAKIFTINPEPERRSMCDTEKCDSDKAYRIDVITN